MAWKKFIFIINRDDPNWQAANAKQIVVCYYHEHLEEDGSRRLIPCPNFLGEAVKCPECEEILNNEDEAELCGEREVSQYWLKQLYYGKYLYDYNLSIEMHVHPDQSRNECYKKHGKVFCCACNQSFDIRFDFQSTAVIFGRKELPVLNEIQYYLFKAAPIWLKVPAKNPDSGEFDYFFLDATSETVSEALQMADRLTSTGTGHEQDPSDLIFEVAEPIGQEIFAVVNSFKREIDKKLGNGKEQTLPYDMNLVIMKELGKRLPTEIEAEPANEVGIRLKPKRVRGGTQDLDISTTQTPAIPVKTGDFEVVMEHREPTAEMFSLPEEEAPASTALPEEPADHSMPASLNPPLDPQWEEHMQQLKNSLNEADAVEGQDFGVEVMEIIRPYLERYRRQIEESLETGLRNLESERISTRKILETIGKLKVPEKHLEILLDWSSKLSLLEKKYQQKLDKQEEQEEIFQESYKAALAQSQKELEDFLGQAEENLRQSLQTADKLLAEANKKRQEQAQEQDRLYAEELERQVREQQKTLDQLQTASSVELQKIWRDYERQVGEMRQEENVRIATQSGKLQDAVREAQNSITALQDQMIRRLQTEEEKIKQDLQKRGEYLVAKASTAVQEVKTDATLALIEEQKAFQSHMRQREEESTQAHATALQSLENSKTSGLKAYEQRLISVAYQLKKRSRSFWAILGSLVIFLALGVSVFTLYTGYQLNRSAEHKMKQLEQKYQQQEFLLQAQEDAGKKLEAQLQAQGKKLLDFKVENEKLYEALSSAWENLEHLSGLASEQIQQWFWFNQSLPNSCQPVDDSPALSPSNVDWDFELKSLQLFYQIAMEEFKREMIKQVETESQKMQKAVPPATILPASPVCPTTAVVKTAPQSNTTRPAQETPIKIEIIDGQGKTLRKIQ